MQVLLSQAERLASRPETDEVGLAVRWVLEDFAAEPARLALPRGKSIDLSRGPVVMGILNVTPDSFSDGGEFLDPERALERALAMREAGAGIVDVGGMSTRPGSDPVPEEEELARILPVLSRILRVPGWDVPVSIDTCRSEVARRALAAGASIVNDVSGLLSDLSMARVVAEAGAAVVVMHMQGTPRTMQEDPVYQDLMGEILSFLRDSVGMAERAGVARDAIVVDPGIGFGKRAEHNLEVLDRLWELRSLGLPILAGTSRKSFIGKTLGRPLGERLFGTAATVALAVARGARIVRVHDVAEMADVARMAWAVCTKEV
ncbi:MAG: dihydropteroate synthase [Planctomycetes bacterium]|nr:dihydropteroate synthase [Planctomycetota bacterium]